MINFELYKIFVIVANEHNIGKASSIIKIPQSMITKNIKLLEKSLNIKLFNKVESTMLLTDIGKELYQSLKKPIDEIIYVDTKFSGIKNINIGSHSRLLNKTFSNCINQFNLEYSKVNLNVSDFETNDMLKSLSNKELDIVFSKRVENLEFSNLKFIKLGYLNDIFIANINSDFYNKILDISDFKNEVIYAPKSYSQTTNRLLSLIDVQKVTLKSSNYDNILELISSSFSIGFVTKEYLDKGSLKKYDLVELETTLNLEPVEFGIYLNDTRFKELDDLVRIIKSYFFFKDF